LYDENSGRLSLHLSPEDVDDLGKTQEALISNPIPPKPGRDHLMQILERLARLESAPTRDFAPFVYRATQKLNWGVTLMVVSPSADTHLSNTLHRLVRAGFNVVLLIIEHYANFTSIQGRARLLGFHAYHVPDRGSLRRWQQVTTDGR
jgi:hypothetical protein